MDKSIPFFIEKMVLYVDNDQHALRACMLATTALRGLAKDSGCNIRNAVAQGLCLWFTCTAIEQFLYRDQVTKDCFRHELLGLQQCEGWNKSSHWLGVADHYIAKVDEYVAAQPDTA